MDKGRISVIVPVYNGEKTLKKCINSITAQTYGDTEIIIVDDGSADGSLQTAQQLARTHERITVLSAEHGGVSATRNIGIERARGEFISFVDCDDEIMPDMLAVMADTLVNGGADLAAVGIERINGGESAFVPYDEQETVFTDNAARLYLKPMYFNSCSNKLYIASVIKERGIHFCEDVYIGEDFLFNAEYARYAKKTAVISRPLYIYRMSGATIAPFSDARRFDMIARMYRAIEMLAAKDAELTECVKRKIYEEYLLAVRLYCMGGARFAEKLANVRRVMRSAEFRAAAECGENGGGWYDKTVRTRCAALVCAYFEVSRRKNGRKAHE